MSVEQSKRLFPVFDCMQLISKLRYVGLIPQTEYELLFTALEEYRLRRPEREDA